MLFLFCWLSINNWLLFESLLQGNEGQLYDASRFYLIYLLNNVVLTIFFNVMLIYGVNSIRRTLRNRESIIPNEKLVNIHIFNFVSNSVFIVVQTVFLLIKFRLENKSKLAE